jgi:KDO2-lipid IV(A) lauroyltransferase
MNADGLETGRCGLDTVSISRIERLLSERAEVGLEDFFSATELADAGNGPGRAASLAGRFAAKEACCKLFPRETALGELGPSDFTIRRDPYGAPKVEPNVKAQSVLDRHRIAALKVSVTHTGDTASAVACVEPRHTRVPWFGKLLYHVFPFRRGLVHANLRRVFGEAFPEEEIRKLAQAYYAHFARFLVEFIRLPFISEEGRKKFIRVENMEAAIRAHSQGKGLFMLTGHFGNWEVSSVAGIGQFPEYKNLFHFLRRPLKPALLNAFVDRRFKKAGFGTLAKRGSLDKIETLLGKGAIIVFVFDQHAGKKDGVVVDFFGHPAGTFKSLALMALTTGAPVIPVYSWRLPDGTHVLKFEDPLPLIECEDVGEAIRKNTRAYNAVIERILLRNPEQWIWMHRRWKIPTKPLERGAVPANTTRI